MNLADAVKRVKRRTGHGTLTNTSDQATQDVVDEINDFINDGWRQDNWRLRQTTSPSPPPPALGLHSHGLDGSVEDLYPRPAAPPRLTWRSYLKWHRDRGTSDSDDQGQVFAYANLGRDSSDKLKIRLLHTPNTTGDVFVGHSKLRLTEYVLGDIATNTRVQFFPEEAHNIICRGARAGVMIIQGKTEAGEALRKLALGELRELWAQENNTPDARLRRPLPGMIRRRMRARGGTRVA